MISENKLIRYEVAVWISGFIIRRVLAATIFPYSSMANYEASKDVFLLLNKLIVAKLILKTRQSKEQGNSVPSDENFLEKEE